MLNISLSLNDTQLNLISGYNPIPNAELDFQNYLSAQMDGRLLPLYRDYVNNKRIFLASQIIDLNIIDKVQGIVDILKNDVNGEYTISINQDGVVSLPAKIEEVIP